MAIPLFKLPILVIKIVLETMGFIDLFILTSSSCKTKRIVKNLVTIRNHTMGIFMEKKEFVFDFCSNSDSNFGERIHLEQNRGRRKDVFYMKIGTICRIPSELSEATDGSIVLTVFRNTAITSASVLFNALMEVFRIPLDGIQMNIEGIPLATCRSWIDWNNNTLSDASIVEIVGKCSSPTYTWLLKHTKTKNCLSFWVEPTDYPEGTETIENLNVERTKLLIKHGKWIKMEQFKAIKAMDISISSASFTDSQINSILREMRDLEEITNLKRLKICFNREANLETVLEGIDVTEDLMKPDDALNQWSFEMASGRKCTIVYAEYEIDFEFGFEFHVGI